MRREKVSFLGDIIVILVIVFFVFLFLNQIKQNNITEIKTVYEKYGVSKQILIPANSNEYIIELSNIKEKEISTNIIEFIKLNQEITTIEKAIYRASVVREDCVSRELRLKINSVTINVDKLINNFEEINSKKNQDIYIQEYVNFLRNIKKQYLEYKLEIDTLDICK